MSEVSGGALAAQVMKNDGVKHIFGLVGGHMYLARRGYTTLFKLTRLQ
jgi:thiamine pyrophosphate-dependent acetolactate synthase large subunit-like protein